MAKQKKLALFHPYKPSFGGEYWYLTRGRSTVVYKETDTNTTIASKDIKVIQKWADDLNAALRQAELDKLRERVDRFLEQGEHSIYAYMASDGAWYCLDCLVMHVLGDRPEDVAELYELLLQPDMSPTNHPEVSDCITEYTVQYEQWPGELIPLEGVKCCKCDNELYAPYEPDGV